MKRYALLSVYDKNGIEKLAEAAIKSGLEILTTGGTAKYLKGFNIPFTLVEDISGQKEIFDGRVKTLNSKIHAAILARRNNDKDMAEINENVGFLIDLVAVSLYPFSKAVNDKLSLSETVELIDVGGPTMLRAAAKNHKDVTVISDAKFYGPAIEKLQTEITDEFRKEMMVETFHQLYRYDRMIANQFSSLYEHDSNLDSILRYGENPHQKAVLEPSQKNNSWLKASLLQGKAMSFNNYVDADAAWAMVKDLPKQSVVIIKHTNPCGAAIATKSRQNTKDIFLAALECDQVSSFGGIIAINGELDADTAAEISKNFYEVIIADTVTSEAKEKLAKKKNLRVIEFPFWEAERKQVKSLSTGDLLVQDYDKGLADEGLFSDIKDPEILAQVMMAQALVKHIKSNAICVVKDGRMIGLGAGQMSRVKSCELAVERDLDYTGAIAASDAFYPFPDGPEVLLKAGIKYIVQPGGSKKDAEVEAAVKELNGIMIKTGRRSFKH